MFVCTKYTYSVELLRWQLRAIVRLRLRLRLRLVREHEVETVDESGGGVDARDAEYGGVVADSNGVARRERHGAVAFDARLVDERLGATNATHTHVPIQQRQSEVN